MKGNPDVYFDDYPVKIIYLYRAAKCVGSLVINDVEAMGDILSVLGPIEYLGTKTGRVRR